MSERAHLKSKQPATSIAGPYGHPFHAVAVTIPIGAWAASFVFDIIGLITGDAAYAASARLLITIGLIGAVIAAMLGLMDMSRLEKGTPARRTALTHMLLNLGSMMIWVIGLLVRLAEPEEIPVPALVLSIAALAVLGASGWLGGKLAYRYGVRVADEKTQQEGFVRPHA